MTKNNLLKGNAGCLVMHQGLVLVVQMKDTGKWSFPAGKPIGNETAEETAVRETFEETGLRVVIKKLLYTFSDRRPFYLFEGSLLDEPPSNLEPVLESKDEIKKVAFVDFKNIPLRKFRFPKAASVIQKLIDDMRK